MIKSITFFVSFICTIAYANAQSRSLFNGKDLAGWHADVPAMDDDPAVSSPFIVRDGKLVSLATPNGHLMTAEVHNA